MDEKTVSIIFVTTSNPEDFFLPVRGGDMELI